MIWHPIGPECLRSGAAVTIWRECLQTFANVFVFVFVFANRRERRLQTGPVCKRLYVFVFAKPTNKRQTLAPCEVRL